MTFVMLGKYSAKAMKDMSGERTKKIADLVKECGGEVSSVYALLGEYDLLFVASFPGVKEAMKASVAVSKKTHIAFSTAAAVSAEEFDELVAGL